MASREYDERERQQHPGRWEDPTAGRAAGRGGEYGVSAGEFGSRGDWSRSGPGGAAWGSQQGAGVGGGSWGGAQGAAWGSGQQGGGQAAPPAFLHDQDYHRWREEQMRMLDREYEIWRQDRYRKFADEFDSWRASRQSGRPGSSTGGNFGSSDATPASEPGSTTPSSPQSK